MEDLDLMFRNHFNSQPLCKTLHITSEQQTGITIESSELEGDILVWQDALYEGPLLDGESLPELSAIRADYFARLGWGEYTEILSLYTRRNQLLSQFLQYNEVVLWFDSGLNNQLQLMQIVNWFSSQNSKHVIISIVSVSRLPDVVGFVDFALLNEQQLEKLHKRRSELTNSQVSICQMAWQCITSTNPTNLLKFFPRDMSSMPFLKNAILRFVQQYPSKNNGLCKTEQLIIQAVKNRKSNLEDIYIDVQGKEPIPFMSRPIFNMYVDHMMNGEHAIIEKRLIEKVETFEVAAEHEGEVSEADVQESDHEVVVEESYEIVLSPLAGQVVNNWVDWVQVNHVDRWLGGVHLQDGNFWRYNPDTRQLNKTYV